MTFVLRKPSAILRRLGVASILVGLSGAMRVVAQSPVRPGGANPIPQAAIDLYRKGNITLATDTTAAIALYQRAFTIAPRYGDAVVAYKFTAPLLVHVARPTGMADSTYARYVDSVKLARILAPVERLAAAHPREAGYQWAIGEIQGMAPSAMAHFKAALALDSTFLPAYRSLASAAAEHGQSAEAHRYAARAAALYPNNVDLAIESAETLFYIDTAACDSALYQVARQFPRDRSKVLAFLMASTLGTKPSIALYERWFAVFPQDEAMLGETLFNLYAAVDPEQALTFGRRLAEHAEFDTTMLWGAKTSARIDSVNATLRAEWAKRVAMLTHYAVARALIARHSYDSAAVQLDSFHVGQGQDALASQVIVARAAIANGRGAPGVAYDSVMAALLRRPTDMLVAAATEYGARLGKSPAQVTADIVGRRIAQGHQATPFSLMDYHTRRNVSLSDFRGKYVLITFWNPGCGSCRYEFPHLKRVVETYGKGRVAYLGINITPADDRFVLPIVDGHQAGFIPLRGSEPWAKQAYDVVAVPENFLIDPQGRIVYSGFYIPDADAERSLGLVIDELLGT